MTLEEKVQQWFTDRNLQTASPVKQFLKLIEETGELFEAVVKDKQELIHDALGDMQVVLIGMEMQLDNENPIDANAEELDLLALVADLGDIASKLYAHIYFKQTKQLDQPDLTSEFMVLYSRIHDLAMYNQATAEDCLEIAYNEIKDRKGKLVDGVWVKSEDLK